VTAANLVDSAARAPSWWPTDGRYVAGRKLGEGASAETFLARDATTHEEVVLKLFQPDARGAELEFRHLAGAAHPSVVRVRDIGRTTDGRTFVVTDFVPGAGIDRIASIANEGERRRAFERAAAELADALAHLHGRGIAHGDLCPANVRLAADGRAVLLDLGLAGPPTPSAGAARGTLGYAAPEALTGARTPAADLFALGATLFASWTGAPPFGVGLAAVQRMLTARAPTLSSVRAGLPAAWDRLLDRLLSPDTRERPSSARQLLREIARAVANGDTSTEADLGVPYPAGDPLEGVFVGRTAERELLRRAFERLADGEAPQAVIALVGAPGSGRRTLIDAVSRDVDIAVAAGVLPDLEILRGGVERIERIVVGANAGAGLGAEDAGRALQRRLAGLVEALERRAAARPIAVVAPDGPTSDALAAMLAGTPPSGRLLMVIPARAPLERPFASEVVLAPLTSADIERLVARALAEGAAPAESIAAIVTASRGHAAIAGILARRLVAAVRAGAGAGGLGVTAEALVAPGDDLDAILAKDFAGLPREARRAAVAAALAGREGGALLEDDERDGALDRGRAAGWLASPELAPASASHRRIALGALGDSEVADVVERASLLLPEGDARRAAALAAVGRVADAVTALDTAARSALERGDVMAAATSFDEIARLAPERLSARDHTVRASALGTLGRYAEAKATLDLAEGRARTDAERLLVVERRAWLLTRTGALREAASVLEASLASAGAGAATRPLAARLGRLLVTMGRFGEALTCLAPLLGSVDGSVDGEAPMSDAIEAAVLAHAYQGQVPSARALLDDAHVLRSLAPGRRAYLEGLVGQLAGDAAAARACYRRAYEASSAAGEVHTVAAVALNLGGLLADEGLYGEALAATERAVRTLGQLGSTAELGTALVNAANLFVQLGDLPAARRALDRARSESLQRATSVVAALSAFVDGDLARREGRAEAAASAYADAASRFYESGQPRRAVSARLSQAEALALAGRTIEARALFEAAVGGLAPRGGDSAPSQDPQDSQDSQDSDVVQAEVRLALAGLGDGTAQLALAERAMRLARAERDQERRPVAWRLAATTIAIFARAGARDAADRARAFARDTFKEIRMATPEHHRTGLDADPDARWLEATPATAATDVALAARAAASESRLRRLLRINKRLNSELRLPRLLETIVDTVIELTDAERGFLLLEDDAGELDVKVARNIDQKTLETAEFELSRSIARRAAEGGEPIVTIDAAGDTRFKEALSVSDLHLRSVLAVPLVVKGRAVGTIYADHRLRKGAFDDDDVKVVLDFADQAAIAIENARLLSELRRRERQVEALNRRLELELAARGEELTGIKQELRESREALAVRYDYRNIVGRTPRMLELFRLLDRLTDTALPVVIQGESGTGKELVARAIHFNGARKDRPFVSENCAAIPETLLESTLFGYQRGAFTGAERDTRGLFEIADGGTLFLDEVGEMSPGMQGKLLRVLQEGELRRVGSERTRKVDVRVVVATNRDLPRMVEEGKFRQDLYYRLAVARIALPPLRERREDIPLIVEHLLAKLARDAASKGGEGAAAKPLDPAALARLVAYRWPGNVRELENELTRAYALSAERITVADLAPAIAASGDDAAAVASDFDSLLLKPRVERLERSLLREALGRSANNQTKAAELLGLSRFGLQKKLKRYRFM
jgi:transcriptional regulator with GAF, ATPase, and Fis domain/tetratricopeptide (TPR) repeat protein